MSARSMICRLAVCLALVPAAAAAQLDKIPWAKGPTKGALGAEATINVPANCLFTGMDGVKPFLERRAGEGGMRAGQQAARLVEVAVRIGRVTHALDP